VSAVQPSADLWALLAIAARPPAESNRAVFDALGLSVPAAFEAWQAAYTEAFVVQCVPQASIYLGAHGAIGGETADRVADFRRLLGSATHDPNTASDHVAELLADYAELAALAAADPQAAHARTALFWEHLGCWLVPFCDALLRSTSAPYVGWARLVKNGCLAEAQALGAPAQPALHHRRAPAWSAGEDAADIDAAVRALCVPAATGLVLTRADLATAGQVLGTALVCGSRAFMLTLLMRQDARATLNWLSAEAGRQADARRVEVAMLGAAAAFWAQRAEASEDALAAMADTVSLAPTRRPRHDAAWRPPRRVVASQHATPGNGTAFVSGSTDKDNDNDEPVEGEDREPDYRFTLANERTFLAWIRTALALLAGSVAFVHLVPELGIPGARRIIGAVLAAISIAVVLASALRWHSTQKAMRRDQPMPSTLMPWLLAGAILLVSLALMATIIAFGIGDGGS